MAKQNAKSVATAVVAEVDPFAVLSQQKRKGPGGKKESDFLNGMTYSDLAAALEKGPVHLWVGAAPDGSAGHCDMGDKLASIAGRVLRVLKPEYAASKGRKGFDTRRLKITQGTAEQRKLIQERPVKPAKEGDAVGLGLPFNAATMGGVVRVELLPAPVAE